MIERCANLDPFLLNMRILLLEFVRQPEGDYRKAFLVQFGIVFFKRSFRELLSRGRSGQGFVDVAQNLFLDERTFGQILCRTNREVRAVQSTAQEASIPQVLQCNLAVALEAEIEEVVHLRDDRRSRLREVEGVGVFDTSEVIWR